MRDSNPRGLAPNPLSKLPPLLFTRVLAVCNERSRRPGLLGEQGRTRATETRIETTTAWATACDGVGPAVRAWNCSLWLLVLHLLIGRSRLHVRADPSVTRRRLVVGSKHCARSLMYGLVHLVWLPD